MSPKRIWSLGLVVLASLVVTSRASADSVSFSWSGGSTIEFDFCAFGFNPFGFPCPSLVPVSTSSGNGSFTFQNGLTSIGITDLTSFSFSESDSPVLADISLCETFGFPITFCETQTYTFGLSDVNSLSASISGGSVTALAMQLVPVNGTLCCEGFTVNSLGAGGAFTTDGAGDVLNTGEVTVTQVVSTTPEPTSLLLLGTGLLGLGAALRRSRKRLGLLPSHAHLRSAAS